MILRVSSVLGAAATMVVALATPSTATTRADPPPAVLVAVLDGGIDDSAPALRGVVDTALSRSFVDADGPPSLHGTLVAGLIAGALSPASAAPIRLLDVRVRDPGGDITATASALAIRYAASMGARVINCSYGSGSFSADEAAAVRFAVSRGSVVIASAGNVAGATVQWPARLQHVIAVGSLGADDRPSAFSDGDPLHLDLTAPGEEIQSTVPLRFAESGLSADAGGAGENGFALGDGGGADGTSFAAAEASAAAARLIALDRRLTADQVRSLLVQSAGDLGAPGYDGRSGWGKLDLTRAETMLAAGATGPADSPETDDDTTLGAPRIVRRARTAIRATSSSDDDQADVRRFGFRAGDHVTVDLRQAAGPASSQPNLDLVAFSPTLRPVSSLSPQATRLAVGFSARPGVGEHIAFTARRTGAFPVAVLAARGSATYWLRVRVAR